MSQGAPPERRGRRAPPVRDVSDRLIGIVQRGQELLLLPVIAGGLSSPLWGPALGWALGWPWWLQLGAALVPITALFINGALREATIRWTRWRPVISTWLQLILGVTYGGLALGLPLAGHYRGWFR